MSISIESQFKVKFVTSTDESVTESTPVEVVLAVKDKVGFVIVDVPVKSSLMKPSQPKPSITLSNDTSNGSNIAETSKKLSLD